MSKRISKMLFKTEKVELGNMTALKGAISILKGAESNADKVATDFEQSISKAGKSYNEVVKYRNIIYNFAYREVEGILKTFASNAKELGVKPDSISEYKEAVKLQKTAFEVIKVLDDYKAPQST